MNILAKPIVDKQFYILTKDDKKVGNIEATDQGYNVKINDRVVSFKTLSVLRKNTGIEFVAVGNCQTNNPNSYQVHGYPSGSRVYNAIWDVQHRLPLYTKTKKSRSWFASGWYQVKQRKNWTVVQSPKLITLQRYSYQGPFHTKEEAHQIPIKETQ